MVDADEIIAKLELTPHPEGGYFRETFRDQPSQDRALSTAIYYLLKENEISAWHRVDAAEIWHWYGGAPLKLCIAESNGEVAQQVLGQNLIEGERPQIIVPVNAWQSARSLGDWTLVGCTVAPGFEFSGFEMAPEGWHPE